MVTEMLKKSELVIAQEYTPSDYDWRIGILDDKPFLPAVIIWQKAIGRFITGMLKKRMTAMEMPMYGQSKKFQKRYFECGLKSAKLMGKGLYGIDLKEVNGKPLVIEINDNPNIDFGVEDGLWG